LFLLQRAEAHFNAEKLGQSAGPPFVVCRPAAATEAKAAACKEAVSTLETHPTTKKLPQMQPAVNTRVHGACSLLGRFGHYAPQPREVAVAASLYRQKNDFRGGVWVIGGN
jgi:hypothetical protein